MVAEWLHMMPEAAVAGGPTPMMEFTRLVITPWMLGILSSGGVTNGQALAQGPYLKIRWAAAVSRGRWDRRRGVEEALWPTARGVRACHLPHRLYLLCPTNVRRTLHDPAVPSVNLDADDRSKLHADAALSALAKSKRSMKKKERPRNTRRQHSNPNVMNASAGREPTRLGRHLRKLKLQALPPCSDHNDDATTAAQYHRRRRRRASRSINPNPSGDHEDDRHDHEREPRLIEPDISPTSEPDICTTLDGQIQAVQHTPDLESITLHHPTYKPGDPFDPKAPRADPPQPGPSNLPARPPEQINRLFDEDELDKACEPGEPFDPKAPRAEPLQPSPSNLPTRLPEQIHHTVPFDEDDDNELDKACEPGEPFDPLAAYLIPGVKCHSTPTTN
ncbi:hypothetical protein THAOC_24244 [Thalassiosira oceanica]|uniref:Uncharacterized protein n=1 Tax=Thalassiosira oceanica TaxID=159749 RepID=K0RSB8_THAOC|nr:hypothetical protein THAOC_24244 [Thalassiosira oceanica]|eukprot:EJK55955.1 hypothetical protein THAOC_24244 [Thalassiosira oceanica]